MDLIDTLKEQSSSTILSYLNRLGEMDDVFSHTFTGSPATDGMHTLFYCSGSQVLLIAMQKFVPSLEELADENVFNDEPPLYFTEDSHRISPVAKLHRAMADVRGVYRAWGKSIEQPKVWGCFITNNYILNADDMEMVWDGMDITVFHSVENMEDLGVPTSMGTLEHEKLLFSLVQRESPNGVPKVKVDTDDGAQDEWQHLAGESDEEDEDVAEENGETEEEDSDEEEEVTNTKSSLEEDLRRILETGQTTLLSSSPQSDNSGIGASTSQKKPTSFSTLIRRRILSSITSHDEDEDDEDEESETGLDTDDFFFSDPIIPDAGDLRVDVLEPLDAPESKLEKMLGCKAIRQQLAELTALTAYNKVRQKINPQARLHEVPLHAIFQGAPGTGKTTMCKIYASLLKKAGVLSKGHVVVATRATFVGCHWGDEETTVTEVLKIAQGGVLMIDEAYQLISDNEKDPGRLVLPLMMPMLADENQRDIAVVLCGYKGPMQNLLDTNEGLRSRFTRIFDFPDFTVPELLDITRLKVSDYGYHFTRQAWQYYTKLIEKAYAARNPSTWGNARFVTNLLDQVYTFHAQRCTRQHIDTESRVSSITLADIKPVVLPQGKRHFHIGFTQR